MRRLNSGDGGANYPLSSGSSGGSGSRKRPGAWAVLAMFPDVTLGVLMSRLAVAGGVAPLVPSDRRALVLSEGRNSTPTVNSGTAGKCAGQTRPRGVRVFNPRKGGIHGQAGRPTLETSLSQKLARAAGGDENMPLRDMDRERMWLLPPTLDELSPLRG